MRTLRKCKVTDTVLNILLLQIAPGFEKEVASKLKDTSLVYKGLGKYDLVIFKEEKGAAFLDERESFLRNLRRNLPPNTLDWMILCGIKWQKLAGAERKFNGKGVVGICCVKLNLKLHESAVELEEKIVDRIYRNIDKAIVYAGLGYNELICIINSETIEDLTATVNKIREMSLEDNKPLILDTTTIPCVRFDYIGTDILKGDTNATILIGLRTCFPASLSPFLKNLLGNEGMSVFGFHDLIIDVKLPTSKLVDNILKLRRDARDLGLYSTYSLVRHENETLKSLPIVSWDMKVPEDKKLLETIKSDKTIPEDLIYYYDAFRIVKHDPLTSLLFRNLHPLINGQIKTYREAEGLFSSENIIDYQEKIRNYFAVFSYLRLSFNQRMSGIEVGNLLGAKSLSFEIIGGIQRVIYALESIPLQLLSKFGISWNGFCVFGHFSSFYSCIPGDILIMPRKSLLRVEDFWGINHETGHIAFFRLFCDDKGFMNKIKKAYQNKKTAFQNYLKKKDEEIAESVLYDFFYEKFADIFSDMFDFFGGFKLDWNLYMKIIWKHLVSLKLVNNTYIIRSYLVYTSLGPGSKMSRKKAKEKFFYDIDQFLGEYGISLDQQAKEDVVAIANEFIDIATFFSSQIRSRFGEILMPEIDKDFAMIQKSLEKGIPLIDADPALIVKSVLTDGNESKMKFAAILSLYDSGVRFYLNES